MFKRTKLISVAAIAALLLSGIATATAATAHPKKKMTHAYRLVPKSTATPTSATPTSATPSSRY